MSPVYCFTDGTDYFEKAMTVQELSACEVEDGVYQVQGRKCCISPKQYQPVKRTGGYPLWSDGLGCHPDEIPEQREFLKQRGISAEFHPETGQIKVEDARHYKRLQKAYGVHFNNCFC